MPKTAFDEILVRVKSLEFEVFVVLVFERLNRGNVAEGFLCQAPGLASDQRAAGL